MKIPVFQTKFDFEKTTNQLLRIKQNLKLIVNLTL